MPWMTNTWAVRDHAALDELGEALNVDLPELLTDVWARAAGLPVPYRGRLHPDIWQAWHDANDAN